MRTAVITLGRDRALTCTDSLVGDEPIYKPGSVRPPPDGGGPATIYLDLTLPPGSCGPPAGSGGPPSNACAAPPHDDAFRPCSRWGLPCHPCRQGRGGLLHHPFTLTGARHRRSALCGTFPRITPGRRYRPPCPVEPGLSSATEPVSGRYRWTRPPDRLVPRGWYPPRP